MGWVTVDNTSNNDTFLEALEEELEMQDIPFNRVECHIQSVLRSKAVIVYGELMLSFLSAASRTSSTLHVKWSYQLSLMYTMQSTMLPPQFQA